MDSMKTPPSKQERAKTSRIVQSGQALRQYVWVLIKVAISATLITWLLLHSDITLSQFKQNLRGIDLSPIYVAVFLPFLVLILTAERWRRLLSSQGTHIPLPKLVLFCAIAVFFAQFLPSTIGSDATRAYYSWKEGATKTFAVAAVGVDRILGALILIYFASISLLIIDLPFTTLTVRYLAGCALIGAISLTLIVFIRNTGSQINGITTSFSPGSILARIMGLFEAVWAFRNYPRTIVWALALGVVMQFIVIMFYWLLAQALGLSLSLLHFLALAPIVIFFTYLPISINGIGLRESGWMAVLVPLSVEPSQALLIAWGEFLIFFGWAIIGGLLYLFVSPVPKSAMKT